MTTSEGTGARPMTRHELAQCAWANQTGRQPVVFVHGLWLLPSCWDRWAALFEEHGYGTCPAWSTRASPPWPGWPVSGP